LAETALPRAVRALTGTKSAKENQKTRRRKAPCQKARGTSEGRSQFYTAKFDKSPLTHAQHLQGDGILRRFLSN
jgi:hypothetical protein